MHHASCPRNPLALVKNLTICSHPLAPGTLNKVNENPLGFPARIAVKPRAVIPDHTNNEKNRNKRRISLRAVARQVWSVNTPTLIFH